MARPSKKLSVNPELRKKWLRFHEENGDSAPQIAEREAYDVRTVRAQIALAQHEREVRETRLVVLRDALQVHYQDLIKFADRMDTLVARGDPLMTLQAERLYSALRQHLPRSPLWKSIEDWNKNCDDMEQARSGLRMELTAVMSQDTNLKQAFDGGQQDAEGVVDFFLKQSEFWSRGWPGLEIGEAFKTSEVENNRVKLKLGAYSIGMSPNNKITEIKKALVSLRKNLPDRSSFQRLTSGFKKANSLAPIIREELATIALRRVVSGRCKYCPI